ncbi:DUF4258 domain-containing protein [Candidatus Magnetomoraceae bacterium gMMP-15]
MADAINSENLFFEVETPLDFRVRVTKSYWNLIISVKHPVMKGCESDVIESLKEPDEIRQSKRDPDVYLFYKIKYVKRWICAVAKRLNGKGFLITTYPTDAIKEGGRIWHK